MQSNKYYPQNIRPTNEELDAERDTRWDVRNDFFKNAFRTPENEILFMQIEEGGRANEDDLFACEFSHETLLTIALKEKIMGWKMSGIECEFFYSRRYGIKR
jgi:hypothetical protein